MLTFEQMLRSTPQETIHTPPTIVIAESVTREGTIYKAKVQGNGRNHNVAIEVHGPLEVHSSAIVTCSCESYAYNFAHALAKFGSGRETYTSYPVRKNPQLKPGLCRHLVAFVRLILNPQIRPNL